MLGHILVLELFIATDPHKLGPFRLEEEVDSLLSPRHQLRDGHVGAHWNAQFRQELDQQSFLATRLTKARSLPQGLRLGSLPSPRSRGP